ncbi:MAG: D-glycerate dehydrogenase [candidate division WOR-3 bacterium]|nr:D-glycerate dehydrogenase [candidate division WOR-3 bacterium]
MEKAKIFITRKIPEVAIELLSKHFKVEIFPLDRPITKSELKRHIKDKTGVIPLLTDNITKEIMDSAPRLKIIANYAAGYNNIDITEATKRGIMVTNTPDVLTETTADLTWGMILGVARRIPEAENFLRKNRFKGWAPMLFLGSDVHHKILGIIGMGRIGKAVARRALGFGMKIIYYDKIRLSQKEEKEYSAEYRTLKYLLKNSDYITIHTPLTPETYHLIDEKELSMMKKTAFLINTARGPIVNEKALVKALKNNRIAGCALDVFEFEPRVSKEFLKIKNALLLPHIGSATLETRTNMALMCAQNIIAALIEKRIPPNLVNPQVIQKDEDIDRFRKF